MYARGHPNSIWLKFLTVNVCKKLLDLFPIEFVSSREGESRMILQKMLIWQDGISEINRAKMLSLPIRFPDFAFLTTVALLV